MSARQLTLIEVMIVTAILAVVLGLTATFMQASMDTNQYVYEQTRVQTEARKILTMIREELSNTAVGSNGQLTYTDNPTTDVQWEFRYIPMSSDPIPMPPTTIPWSTVTRVIRFEFSEPDNGSDDDGDLLIDEGRVVLYTDNGTLNQVAVLGEDIATFTVTPENAGERRRYTLQIRLDRILRNTIKNAGDVAEALAGTGHRARYESTIEVTVPGNHTTP